jgi:hypothetical protein
MSAAVQRAVLPALSAAVQRAVLAALPTTHLSSTTSPLLLLMVMTTYGSDSPLKSAAGRSCGWQQWHPCEWPAAVDSLPYALVQ